MSKKPLNEWTKEELVSYLFCAWVAIAIQMKCKGLSKQDAVERYMRTYLRSLTLGELVDAIEWTDQHNEMQPWLENKIDVAVKGYDAYMVRRGKVRA